MMQAALVPEQDRHRSKLKLLGGIILKESDTPRAQRLTVPNETRGRYPLPPVFFAPVAKVFQISRVGPGGVLRLGLGGKVLQSAEALLQFAQAGWIFERLRFRDALRFVIWAIPRIRATFFDQREAAAQVHPARYATRCFRVDSRRRRGWLGLSSLGGVWKRALIIFLIIMHDDRAAGGLKASA
jgi:hypothetical protein